MNGSWTLDRRIRQLTRAPMAAAPADPVYWRSGVTAARPVLVGRRRELATVTALLDGLRRGHGGVALVVGEAGIGKSRLLAEAVARARSLGRSSAAATSTSPAPAATCCGAREH